MLNPSALAAAILVGLFTLFISYVAVQPAIQSVLLRLAQVSNEPFLTFVSQVLSYCILPSAAARITYLASMPSRRYNNHA